MEMRLYRSIECRLRKLIFFFIITGKKSMLDFTHQCVFCCCSVRCVFFLHHVFICLIWSCCLHANKAATATTNRKKVWKRNIDEIYDFKVKPIIMQQHHNYTCIALKMHLTAMTLQLQPVNSAILTVCLFSVATVRYDMSFEFSTLAAFAHNLSP